MIEQIKGKIMSKVEYPLGRIVSKLVPGIFLFGTEWESWYAKNPYHKLEKGDILILKRNRELGDEIWDLGHGVRPVLVVNNYKKEGNYDITVHIDNTSIKEGAYGLWIYQNKVPKGVERIVREETRMKIIIENNFKKVKVNSIEEALALYKSREIEQQELVQNRKK
jgi:hypothetical protein